MNEFEKKLRSRKFLPPPAEVRDAVLAAGMRVRASAPALWREWLWPSPLAWGAVAAVLLAALMINSQLSRSRMPATASGAAPHSEPLPGAEYAFFQDRNALDWLEGTR